MSLDNEEDFFQHLVETGALKPVDKNESGEVLFVFDIEILKTVSPEFYNALQDELDEDLKKLYDLGFVNVSYNENLEATFQITQKGKDFLAQRYNS